MSLLLLVFRLLSHELGGDQLRRLGQEDPFGLLHHPPLQHFRRVAGENGDGLLQEDLSAVGNVVYIMHGGASVLDAPGQSGLMDLEPIEALAAEGGDQGGVDVEDAISQRRVKSALRMLRKPARMMSSTPRSSRASFRAASKPS